MRITLFILIFNLSSCCFGERLRVLSLSGSATPIVLFPAGPRIFLLSFLFHLFLIFRRISWHRVDARLQLQTSLVAVASGLVPLSPSPISVNVEVPGPYIPLVTVTNCVMLRQSLTQFFSFCIVHLPQFSSLPWPKPWPKPWPRACPSLRTHWWCWAQHWWCRVYMTM